MNDLTTKLGGALSLQTRLIGELNIANKQLGADFSEYGTKCVMNAIAGLYTYCNSEGIDFQQIDFALLKLSLQNIGYTELNYSAIPSEIYFDVRKNGEKFIVTIKPQGAGNEKLTRRYGVGLKKDIGLHSPWIVREGDEFTYPSFNGLEMIPPKWSPKSFDKKVIMVVYPAVKVDGSVEYLIATRESVKANMIAQIRQNALYAFTKYENQQKVVDKEKRDEFYEKLNKFAESHSLEELLNNEEFSKYVNPTYTSGGSKEAMIIRKMKNNALKNYPKEYDNAYIRDAVENMFEEKDDSLNERPTIDVNPVDKVEGEINETPKQDAIQDFNVDANGEVQQASQEEPKQDKVEEKEPVKIDPIEDTDYGF